MILREKSYFEVFDPKEAKMGLKWAFSSSTKIDAQIVFGFYTDLQYPKGLK